MSKEKKPFMPTELDFFLLEHIGKKIFGKHYELKPPAKVFSNKKPCANRA